MLLLEVVEERLLCERSLYSCEFVYITHHQVCLNNANDMCKCLNKKKNDNCNNYVFLFSSFLFHHT